MTSFTGGPTRGGVVSSGGIPSKALPVLLDGGLVGGRKTGGVGVAGLAGSTGGTVTGLARQSRLYTPVQ